MSFDRVMDLLARGTIETEGLLPWSSNYTFLATVRHGDQMSLAVYKPRSGERPLWDFPHGTLCLREVATFVVSQGLGWVLVPPTVLRDGPHGVGSVQLYIDADAKAHYFTLQEDPAYADAFRRIAILDVVVNNADRKSGHCLLDRDGRVWAVDHGITFHVMPKLRTVIWEFAGEPIPGPMLDDLRAFRTRLDASNSLTATLERLLAAEEMDALRQRVDALLKRGTFPNPDPRRRHIPWPPV